MSIQALKRIKGPGDFVEPLFQSLLALRKLQIEASLCVSIFGSDSQHMGMHRRAPCLESRKRVSKADHPIAFESAEDDTTRVLRCNQSGCGYDVQIAESPRFLLNLFNLAMLSLAPYVAYNEFLVVHTPFEHNEPTCHHPLDRVCVDWPHAKRLLIISAN